MFTCSRNLVLDCSNEDCKEVKNLFITMAVNGEQVATGVDCSTQTQVDNNQDANMNQPQEHENVNSVDDGNTLIGNKRKLTAMRILEKNASRVAITTDMWTSSNQKKGFMAITAHLIDDNWNMQSRIMRFIYVTKTPTPVHQQGASSSSLRHSTFKFLNFSPISDNPSSCQVIKPVMFTCSRNLVLDCSNEDCKEVKNLFITMAVNGEQVATGVDCSTQTQVDNNQDANMNQPQEHENVNSVDDGNTLIGNKRKLTAMRILEKNASRVAITTDMWTSSNQKKGFMAITAHLIDDNWNMQSRIMRLYTTDQSEIEAEKVKKLIYELFEDYETTRDQNEMNKCDSDVSTFDHDVSDNGFMADFSKYVEEDNQPTTCSKESEAYCKTIEYDYDDDDDNQSNVTNCNN
ncbi:hypothetical protein L1887_32060 [Cichorium endivia]|nr:hypothetical protein L1887_32060 [Cichorium endivia]